jgi:hypothetical protein
LELLVSRRRALIAAVLGAAVAASTLGAQAATPAAGHLGTKQLKLTWKTSMLVGSPFGYVASAGKPPVPNIGCPASSEDPLDAVCDHYTLSVDVPTSYWEEHHGGVDVLVPRDFYGYAYTADGRIAAASAYTGDAHLMTIPLASGTYEIRLAPYFAIGTSAVTARFVSELGAETKLSGNGFAAYHGTTLGRQPRSKPFNKAIPYAGPPLEFRSTYVGHSAVEPTMGVDKEGKAFFIAATFDGLAGARSLLLRSGDDNASWTSAQPPVAPGVSGDGHPVTQDPYLYVDPQYGRVFDVDLTLAGSYLSFSDDQGKTWTRGAAISVFGVNDHQTLFTGPPVLGLPTTDPDFPKVVYYCVNQLEGSFCAHSLDGGRTFLNGGAPAFAAAGSDAQGETSGCGGLHGHGVTDSKGRVFLPRGCGSPVLAVSDNGGATWREVQILSEGSDIGVADVQTSIAVDAADNLYYVWWDDVHQLPYLSVSRNAGASWSRPRMIAPPGVQAVNFPTIAAGSPGRIAITFPGTLSKNADDITRPWFSYVVESVDALGYTPTFLSVVANPGGLADPIHRGDCFGRCGRMYDFLDVVVDASGIAWGTATDTCTPLAECSTRRVGGFSDLTDENGAAESADGVAFRQISGPPLVVR